MRARSRWWLALAPVAALSLGIASERFGGYEDTRLTFLAVGQGDCAVFQHDGKTVLIDAGPRTDSFDAGERIVVPRLREMGVRVLDLVLLSHPDADHVGGLRAVSRRFRIGVVAASSCFRGSDAMRVWLNEARISESSVVWVERRRVVRLGEYRIRLDAPDVPAVANDNDGSLFVRIERGGQAAQFSGDASTEVESLMLSRPGPWASTILKLGHHGSRTSTSEAWLAATTPTWAVVSVGRNNRYGHPNAGVLSLVGQSGAVLVRTDREGTIVFLWTSEGWVRHRAGRQP